LYGLKTLKNRSNDPLGPSFGSVYLLWSFFAIFALFRTFLMIFLLNKASDERGVAPPFSILTHFELYARR
jgi:hypothetical protein